MSEKISRSFSDELHSRRNFTKKAAAIGTLAVSGAFGPMINTYQKIGNDYGNEKFWDSVDAVPTDRARLNELLGSEKEHLLTPHLVGKNYQNDPEAFAEVLFMVDKPGPVYAEFEGLMAREENGTSLTILKASIEDEDEEFLIPIIRDPYDQSPVSVQFGMHEAGLKRLSFSVVDDPSESLESTEIVPRLTRGSTDTVHHFINIHQPDMYLRNYRNLPHNFPLRSSVFVHETPEGLALVYWQECIDEDKEFGRFGTSVQQLWLTKLRPTDNDWVLELAGDPETGIIHATNIAEPWHNSREISTNNTPHTPLQIASRNNNVKLVTSPHTLRLPRIRFLPEIFASNERREALYTTSRPAARLSVCENLRKGTMDLQNPQDIIIIEQVGLNAETCQAIIDDYRKAT